ncbi:MULTISPECIES: universal stress protein [Cryobacterium]|uniref:Universal stress protein n=1 Tax=Cryobacterium breve TaxID=1259258 RepID=A0ABY2IZZ8_9MICO|nr:MULTISPECIES: universal stress protein [Cryobacterium]TFC95958.1 universal stress protein [Cryobacterium sp. TmT3-12]TFC97929.1 universal stress protein [Cryobacterium breve]
MSDTQQEQTPVSSDTIVVGHDGSGYADHAVAVALDLAQQLHAPVVLVRAWSIDTAPRPANWEFGYVSSIEEYADAVREELVEAVMAEVARHPDLKVAYRAVYASPLKSLIDASRGARMLVVGSRGRGGLSGMLLGSVSEQCVRHATCPVLVVRPNS